MEKTPIVSLIMSLFLISCTQKPGGHVLVSSGEPDPILEPGDDYTSGK